VAVLRVQTWLAVVLADVVLTLDALLAGAARVVARPGDAVPDRPAEGLGARPQGDDLTGPLVARRERERGGPEARVVTADQVGVGATGTGFSWISRTFGSWTTSACIVSVINFSMLVGSEGDSAVVDL
jgi:hypothetical protein